MTLISLRQPERLKLFRSMLSTAIQPGLGSCRRQRSLVSVALAREVLAHKSHRLAGRNEVGYVLQG